MGEIILKITAGAQFTLGFETLWSKSFGYVLLYLNGEPEWTFNGPTLYKASKGVYFKWGLYTNTWRLKNNTRTLYQIKPNTPDCKHTIQVKNEASIDSVILEGKNAHKFTETRKNHRAEFKCSKNYVDGETSYHERTIILPDDWIPANDATVIMQYHAWPDSVRERPNLTAEIYETRIIITIKNDEEMVRHRIYSY